MAANSFLDQQPLHRVQVRSAEQTAALLSDKHHELAVLGVAGEDFRDDLKLGALTPLMLGAVTNHSVDSSGPGERPFEGDVSERRSDALLAKRWQTHVLLGNSEDDLFKAAQLLRGTRSPHPAGTPTSARCIRR